MSSTTGTLIDRGTTTTQTVTLDGSSYSELDLVLQVDQVWGSVTITVNELTESGMVVPVIDGLAVTSVPSAPLSYRIGKALTPSNNAVANQAVPPSVQVVVTVSGTASYGLDYIGMTQ